MKVEVVLVQITTRMNPAVTIQDQAVVLEVDQEVTQALDLDLAAEVQVALVKRKVAIAVAQEKTKRKAKAKKTLLMTATMIPNLCNLLLPK